MEPNWCSSRGTTDSFAPLHAVRSLVLGKFLEEPTSLFPYYFLQGLGPKATHQGVNAGFRKHPLGFPSTPMGPGSVRLLHGLLSITILSSPRGRHTGDNTTMNLLQLQHGDNSREKTTLRCGQILKNQASHHLFPELVALHQSQTSGQNQDPGVRDQHFLRWLHFRIT